MILHLQNLIMFRLLDEFDPRKMMYHTGFDCLLLVRPYYEAPNVGAGYDGDAILLRCWVIEHFLRIYSYIMTQPSGYNDYGVCGATRHDKMKKELFHMDICWSFVSMRTPKTRRGPTKNL